MHRRLTGIGHTTAGPTWMALPRSVRRPLLRICGNRVLFTTVLLLAPKRPDRADSTRLICGLRFGLAFPPATPAFHSGTATSWNPPRGLKDRLTTGLENVKMLANGPRRGDRTIAYRIDAAKCATVPWLCGDCRPECPNQAISTAHVIDPARCTECVGAHESPRCAGVCAANACEPDPERPESRERLLARWRELHSGEEPALGTY
jgi:ferredoxin